MKNLLLNSFILLISTSSYSSVFHTSLNTTLTPFNETSITIESKTILFSHWSFQGSGFQIDGNNDFTGLIEVGTNSTLDRLNFGEVIDTMDNFVSFSDFAPAYHNQEFAAPQEGVLQDGESTYFGFQVAIDDSFYTYFAWIKVTRRGDNVVIEEYAYEDQVGQSIVVGSIGQVTGLAHSVLDKTNINIVDRKLVVRTEIYEYTVELYSMNGMRLKTGHRAETIELNNLKPGVYITRLVSSVGIKSQRVFIQ